MRHHAVYCRQRLGRNQGFAHSGDRVRPGDHVMIRPAGQSDGDQPHAGGRQAALAVIACFGEICLAVEDKAGVDLVFQEILEGLILQPG